MPETKRPLKVFLCHAHSDAAAVRDLYRRLVKDGVDAWLDKEKLLPGQDWELEIRQAVREADVVVVCLSRQFNQRGFRQKEVRLALDTAIEMPDGEIFIIPARLEECDTLESLRKWHWVDLFEDDGYEMLLRALHAQAGKKNVPLQPEQSYSSKSTFPRSKSERLKETAAESRKPVTKKTKSSRRLKTAILVALIGAVATIVAALVSSPLLANILNPQAQSMPSLANTPISPGPMIANGRLAPIFQVTVGSRPARGVAFSPDGAKLAVASEDGNIYLVNATDGKELIKITGHTNVVSSVAWSPDGSQLASASDDQTVRIWNAVTGEQVSLYQGTNLMYSVDWSHDGGRIASTAKDARVTVLDAKNGAVLFQIDKGSYGNDVAWSPDDRMLAVSAAMRVFVFDTSNGAVVQNLVGDWGDVNGVAWSPDGEYLAAASRDGEVHLWQAKDWKGQVLQGHTSNATDVVWFPHSKFLASISYDRTVRVWDAKKGEKISLELATEGALNLALSRDGKLLAGTGDVSGVGYLEVWDMAQLEALLP